MFVDMIIIYTCFFIFNVTVRRAVVCQCCFQNRKQTWQYATWIEYVRTFYKCSFIEEETHNLHIFTAIVALFEFEFNRDTQFKFLASTVHVLDNKN